MAASRFTPESDLLLPVLVHLVILEYVAVHNNHQLCKLQVASVTDRQTDSGTFCHSFHLDVKERDGRRKLAGLP